MSSKSGLFLSILCASTLVACAAEDGFTPIGEEHKDSVNTLHESRGQCLLSDGCDMQFHLSYAGSDATKLDVTLIDPTTDHELVDAWGVHSYDAASNRSTWSFPYWDGEFGEYIALAKSTEGPLSEVEFSWQSGKSVYKDRFNPTIGESCGVTLSCPDDLECIKLHEGIGQGYTCVTRCFTDAQCSDKCEPLGDLAVEGVEGVCSSNAIQG